MWSRIVRPLGPALALLSALGTTLDPVEAAVDSRQRSALVVGNASYGFSPLDNPINDARAMAGALGELGFEVTLIENADQAELMAAVEAMARSFPPDGVGLFYYAGHAVQYQGVNYLLPTDFDLDDDVDLPADSIDINAVIQAMERSGTGINLVVLDACRDYPFGDLDEAYGQGLAGVATGGETLVAYATAAGRVALDGIGPNSPYTSALISALELPGHDVYDVFRVVRGKVRQATGGRQLPWVSGSIESRVVLRDLAPPIQLASAEITLPVVHWNTIHNSVDPTDFVDFLRSHPDSPFARGAVERIQLLNEEGRSPVGEVTAGGESFVGPGNRIVSISPCDVWAADPFDPQRVTSGTPWGLVNTRQALRACAEAVAQDPRDPRLNFQLARALDIAERFEEAMSFYRVAADAGYAKALANMGFMHRTGRGTPRDFDTAADYYHQAAIEGVPATRGALAKLYEEGWGVPQSYERAFYWYKLAADDGFAPAIDAVGKMYLNGWGVDPDPVAAARYIRMAATLGWGNAYSNLGKLYAEGKGVPRDLEEAVRWFAEGTERGNAYAPYHWAGMLRTGEAGVKDPRYALSLYELSADRGFEWALWKMAEMHEKGELGEPDLEQAYYNFWIARAAGEMRRNSGADELARLAGERLEVIRPRLGERSARIVEQRAEAWIAQNSLFQFTLTSLY